MAKNTTSAYRFRVSDAVQVPLRGLMLRLKLLEGTPDLEALEPGGTIRLQAPNGDTRTAEVKAFSLTGGAASSDLETYKQLDLIVAGGVGEPPVGIGWFVVG